MMADVSTANSSPTVSPERAWAPGRTIDPAGLDDAQPGAHRHPDERRALLTIGIIIIGIDLLLLLIGPERRDALRASLHWTPGGVVGWIEHLFHPGGVVRTVLIFLLGTALVDLYNHWLKRAEVISESSEVTANTFPALYATVEELRQRFELPSVRVFVQRSATKPYSVGIRAPQFVVLPFLHLSLLSEDELRFVLGREFGHIKLGHTRLAPFMGGADWSGSGVLKVLSQVRSLLLSSYERAQELSADRIGVIACKGVAPAVSAILQTSVGSTRGARLDVTTLAAQAAEAHRGAMKLANHLRQTTRAQPSLFFRLRELVVWAGLPAEEPMPATATVSPPAAAPAMAPITPAADTAGAAGVRL